MALTTFQQLRDMTARLNRYNHEYHDLKAPSVTDAEYDRVLGDLTALENTIATRMADSPTWKFGYPSVKELKKAVHAVPLAAPDVTVRIEDLVRFVGEQSILIMLNLDGPTVQLTYEGGELVEAAVQGVDVTHNTRAISGIPAKIIYQERLVVLGKVFIHSGDFEELKNVLTNSEGQPYPSEHDFSEDSVCLLESAVCRGRHLSFMPFHVLEGFTLEGVTVLETKAKLLKELGGFGFCGSPCLTSEGALSRGDLNEAVKKLSAYAQKFGLPLAGVLFTYNDVAASKGPGKDSLIFNPAADCGQSSPFAQCLTAMSIPTLDNGSIQALDRHFGGNLDDFESAVMIGYDFSQIPKFSKTSEQAICQWFQDEEKFCLWMELREQAGNGGK